MITISVAKDFSKTPGPRYKKDGKFSGQEFRENILKPRFDEAIMKKEKLYINLDGGYGYLVSFLEESFGGLARIYNPELVYENIVIISNDEPSLINEVKSYIFQEKGIYA